MIRLVKRVTWHLLFWSLLASALSLTAIRLGLHSIGHFQQEITAYVSDLLGTPVTIGHLTTKMRGVTPELQLKDIAVASKDGHETAIRLQEIRIRLNLWSLLANREVLPATAITLVGTELTVQRNQDGSFSVMGLKAGDDQPDWLLQGKHYEMLQSKLIFRDVRHPDKALKPAKADVAIHNTNGRHDIKAIINLPPRYGGSLDVAMTFTGNFFTSERIDGRAYIEANGLRSTEIIADYFPALGKPDSGILDGTLWLRINHSGLRDVQGSIQLNPYSNSHPHTLISRFHWFQLKHHHARWQLDVPQLTLTNPRDKSVSDNSFSLAADFSLRAWAWSIKHLNISDANHIGQWLFPSPLIKRLALYRPSGNLNQFSGFVKADQGHFAAQGNFTHLSFASVDNQPAVTGLSGTFVGDQQQGLIRLAAKNAQFVYPDLFRQALAVNQLSGTIHWQQTENKWLVSSPSLKLEVPGIRSEGKLQLSLSKQSSPPFLDWQMVLTNPDVSQLKRYLPAKAMKQVDVDWFDAAFVKGRISKGRILYYGPLGPLNSAVFRALLDVDGIELSYDPEWPNLTGLKGRVSFIQNKMICEANQGHSLKMDIVNATVTHPAISASKQLLIEGKVKGTLPHAMEFLSQTELNEDLGGLISAIQTEGQTDISLDINLALNKQGRTRVNGKTKLNSARLNVKAIDLWLEGITGELKFNETGIYSDTLSAIAFNKPTSINISHNDRKTQISAQGKASITALKNQFALPLWDFAEGVLAYRLLLDLPRDASPANLNVASDLKGVRLDLPAPLAKGPGQHKPLSVHFSLVDSPMLPISINYNNQFKAAIKFNTDTEKIYSGHLLLGEGTVNQALGTNLDMEINYPSLDLSVLGALSATTPPQTDSNSPAFTHLSIHSQDARWKNQPIGAFRLSLEHQGDYWTGAVHSTIAQGNVRIPVNLNPNGKINIDLEVLDVSPLENSDDGQPKPASPTTTTALKPEKLPLLDITSQKFLWRGVDLGQLSLYTERTQGGISIKQGKLIGAQQKLEFSGHWKNSHGRTTTEIEGSLSAAKTGQLLSRLEITKDFKETAGKLDFFLTWKSPPYDFQLASLSGKLEAILQNGRIMSIEPGFGRVLGLIAMAQWGKRLQLDFQDIFADGLSFNSIKGRFKLNKGIAHTNNLVVDAVPAKINITGNANLINKTLDQTVRVIPKSADALPIAGTIIDSVVDIASRTLTGKSGEGLFLGSEYRIQGDWKNANIIPIHENDGLVKKTWNTLTDLPWLPSDTNDDNNNNHD